MSKKKQILKNILITGATGNIGYEVIRYLTKGNTPNKIYAGVRNTEKAKHILNEFREIDYTQFDFENPDTFDKALDKADTLFLLRPPHISNIKKYFQPLIHTAKTKGINKIVFLSVQGADKSKIIPHNKIERLIKKTGIDHVFIRPGYFMQNLTTTLLNDIKNKRIIILPAGAGKFNWIDVRNIGEIAAIVLNNFQTYKNNAYDVTGYENLDFYTVVNMINKIIDDPVTYKSVNPVKFYFIKRRDGVSNGKTIVMLMLHMLPRFQKEPEISSFYQQVTGKKPNTLNEFLTREKETFQG